MCIADQLMINEDFLSPVKVVPLNKDNTTLQYNLTIKLPNNATDAIKAAGKYKAELLGPGTNDTLMSEAIVMALGKICMRLYSQKVMGSNHVRIK